MIMIIICNRGSHLLRVIYNIMHFSGRSVVPLSTCSTFQWSANGHGPAPLPRPPAAAIQWQLYFSACDGCFETKFAKVQTIHSMINDSSGREEQHLASGQRKLAVGHNMSYSSSRDSPMRAFCLSPQYNKEAGRLDCDRREEEGTFYSSLLPVHSLSHPGAACPTFVRWENCSTVCKPKCKCGISSFKVTFHNNKWCATVRPCTMWHLWCELRFENW